jgi:hypothetical protein
MSGTLQATVLKDGASSTNNITLDASGNATIGNNLTVTGTTTLTGAFTSAVTAPSFIPTGTTVPANGMYRSAANTLDFATNTTNQMSISSAGIVTGTAGNLMLVQGTAQASTSGTAISFTGIPSWVKRVTMNFVGFSTSGTSGIIIQLGSSGGYLTSGYNGSATNGASSTTNTIAITTGHGINGAPLAANLYYGSAVFNLISGNTWVGSSVLGSTTGTPQFGLGGSGFALAGTLDRIQVTTVNGTDTFDSGTVNIQYE